MPESDNEITFRVWGLPASVLPDEAVAILQAFFDTASFKTEPRVHSLGYDPWLPGRDVDMVATVTFSQVPADLERNSEVFRTKTVPFRHERLSLSLTIDTTFMGITPLNSVKNEDGQIDCIAISGLSSHAFGSWKQRGGSFMWLRDVTNWRIPTVRVLLYGYDTSLVQSESFQDLKDISNKFADILTRTRPRRADPNFQPCPIVFLAHSLGGLIVKESMCRLATIDPTNAHCVYGLVFFGVPNQGIRISQWLPMVKNQPNESLIRHLAPDSQYLRELRENFNSQFASKDSILVSIYETLRSKTAQQGSSGKWALTGATEVLVTRESAMDGSPPGWKHDCVLMN